MRIDEAQRACERLRSRRPPGGRRRLLPAGRAAPAARRVRGGRGRLPPGQPVGTRAPARAGPAPAGAGPGRCRAGGDPPRGGRGRRTAVARSRLLPAHVEIMLAAGDVDAARAAADELAADRRRSRRAAATRAAPPTHEGAVLAGSRATPAPRSARCARRGRRGRSSRPPRSRPGPGPHRTRLPGARGRGHARRWSSMRRAGPSEQLGAAPDVARIDALSRGRPPSRRRADRPRARGPAPGGGRQDQPHDRSRPLPVARRRSRATSATSSSSSGCRAGRRRPPTPTSTT